MRIFFVDVVDVVSNSCDKKFIMMIFFAFLMAVVRGAIVINEIMYNHALGML